MAVGDYQYYFDRLYGKLPVGWFPADPTDAPMISSIIGAVAVVAANTYAQLSYTNAQTRLLTATGIYLDMIANEYLGYFNFPRRQNEDDDTYRLRILNEILRPRGTKAAIISALHDLTGYYPTIFHPVDDAQGWDMDYFDSPTMLLGDYNLPYTSWVEIRLPPGAGIPYAEGWDSGFYDADDGFAYGDDAELASIVGQQEIFNTITLTAPDGVSVYVYAHP